ncbi:MAG: alanine-synthesizing transaminase, partial [Chitinophagales bacterium]
LDFLTEKHVLLVHGTAFNWKQPDHFRIVFLPHLNELKTAIEALGKFLDSYRQS